MSPCNNPTPAVGTGWPSPSHVHSAFLLLATLLGTYLCYLLALPFLPSLVWAIGLAVLAAPYQNWLERKVGHPGLSSLGCTCVLGLLVVIPVTFAVQQLALQASGGAILMEAKIESGEWRQIFSSQPKVASLVERLGMQIDLPGISKTLATTMSSAAMSLLKGSVYQMIDFGLTFYFLFFLLRDRALAIETLCKFSPLTIPQMALMVQRVNETICATVYGSFVVASSTLLSPHKAHVPMHSTGRATQRERLFTLEFPAVWRLGQSENNDLFPCDRTDIVMQTDRFYTGDVANDLFESRPRDFDQLRSNLL